MPTPRVAHPASHSPLPDTSGGGTTSGCGTSGAGTPGGVRGTGWRRPAALLALSCLLTVGLAATLNAQIDPVAADPAANRTGPADATTAKLAAQLLGRYHVGGQKLDDEISRQLFERFFETLDPFKLYFEADDVDDFRSAETRLDDFVLSGDLRFVDAVYERYLARLRDRVGLADRLIGADFDFTRDEEIVADPDLVAWANTPAEVQDRWRKRIKYDVLELRLEDEPIDDIRDRLRKRYSNLLAVATQADADDRVETFLTALANCFDPHSTFMSEKTLEDFQISMNLSLEGIGAALQNEDGYITVKQIIQGGAAEEDGRLGLEDRIIGVAQGGESEFTDVVEMRIGNVVRLIRGEKGTNVRLQVLPAGGGDAEVIELTRRKIELKDSAVRGEIYDVSDRVPGAPAVKVGVIHVPGFYRDFAGASAGVEGFSSASRDVRDVLGQFERAGGVDAVVVDLRYNGGGALTEAIEVTGLFIDQGPVVQVKNPDGRVKRHLDERPGVAWRGPLAVLTNRLSASASEIFAGAVKDYGRGIVVGDETTHGKGTVQNVMPVPRERLFAFLGNNVKQGALKLTIEQFYRVNGDSTQNLGVRSDVVLPSVLDHMELGEQYLDNALEFDRIGPADYRAVGMTGPALVADLRGKSQARVSGDPEWDRTAERIARFERDREKKTVSLNEQTRRRERAEREALAAADEEAEEQERQPGPGEGPILRDTPYNNEVLAVVADYVALLKNARTAQR